MTCASVSAPTVDVMSTTNTLPSRDLTHDVFPARPSPTKMMVVRRIGAVSSVTLKLEVIKSCRGALEGEREEEGNGWEGGGGSSALPADEAPIVVAVAALTVLAEAVAIGAAAFGVG